MNKCINCNYGANQIGYRGSIYKLKNTIKKKNNKIITIDYINDGHGCRKSEWNKKEDKCLGNNFSEFKEFVIV